ncbi:hypothetical protein FRACA_80014 [Frankia canadensis]|uniref:Uncharacterized protein n=1 Tax=Frankia canadensis TaxID=1836972 RepID=A0A2I2L1C1_9ACTN|nr:hypothetical protein FRACA_80014 [Frankia canadensis]SOU59004.1 hypothetical protein FRACA_80014 [Frankia canadensis]
MRPYAHYCHIALGGESPYWYGGSRRATAASSRRTGAAPTRDLARPDAASGGRVGPGRLGFPIGGGVTWPGVLALAISHAAGHPTVPFTDGMTAFAHAPLRG